MNGLVSVRFIGTNLKGETNNYIETVEVEKKPFNLDLYKKVCGEVVGRFNGLFEKMVFFEMIKINW